MQVAAMTCGGRGQNVRVGHDEEVGWDRSRRDRREHAKTEEKKRHHIQRNYYYRGRYIHRYLHYVRYLLIQPLDLFHGTKSHDDILDEYTS